VVVRAVLFDFGETLAREVRHDIKRVHRFVVKELQRRGYTISWRKWKRAIGWAINKLRELRRKQLRDVRFEELYGWALERLGVPLLQDLLEEAHQVYVETYGYELVEGVKRLLKELANRYQLGVVSNAISRIPRAVLDKEGLLPLFETVVISGEVGWLKPHPRIFHEALRRLRVRAREAVFVGDSIDTDVVGAKNVGMLAVWVCHRGVADLVYGNPDAIITQLSSLPEVLCQLERRFS